MTPNITIETSTWSAWTARETPSLVRSSPYTIHGCRPTSAATQPSWLAAYGPATANTNTHISQRVSNSVPRQRRKPASRVSAMNAIPSATMTW